MKKLTTVLLAAGLLALTGCSASAPAAAPNPQLSTKETCDRINAFEAGGGTVVTQGKARYQALKDAMQPLVASESPDLKTMAQDQVNYSDAMMADHPDEAKIQELEAKAAKSVAKVSSVCSGK